MIFQGGDTAESNTGCNNVLLTNTAMGVVDERREWTGLHLSARDDSNFAAGEVCGP